MASVRIHCIMRVRSELDVIRYSLPAAVAWATSIHVIDNGSTDGSDEFVSDLRDEHPEIISLERFGGTWSNDLIGRGVRAIRHRARRGDWWCVLDADELYPEDPTEFIAAVPASDDVVIANFLQFYLTERDLGIEHPMDWAPELSRYFLIDWSEYRFVRHQPLTPWWSLWPVNMPALRRHPVAIAAMHYQYRSPGQAQQRIDIRRSLPRDFVHERGEWTPAGGGVGDLLHGPGGRSPDDWRSRVVRSTSLRRWDGQLPTDATGPPVRDGLLIRTPLVRSLVTRAGARVHRSFLR